MTRNIHIHLGSRPVVKRAKDANYSKWYNAELAQELKWDVKTYPKGMKVQARLSEPGVWVAKFPDGTLNAIKKSELKFNETVQDKKAKDVAVKISQMKNKMWNVTSGVTGEQRIFGERFEKEAKEYFKSLQKKYTDSKSKDTKYKSVIRKDGTGDFYALIVRVDSDGQENVIHGYKGKYFKTKEAAEKSTREYMTKYNLN